MSDDFYEFIAEPKLDAFLNARNEVINHPDYEPYSSMISDAEEFLIAEKYDEMIALNDVNSLLSPRMHSMKSYAYEKKELSKEASMEHFFGQRVLDNILLTGDGSKESPYLVLRVHDEKDILNFLGEKFKMQALYKGEGFVYDSIQTESGKSFYFDITACYAKLPKINLEEFLRESSEESKKKKPWWKFW